MATGADDVRRDALVSDEAGAQERAPGFLVLNEIKGLPSREDPRVLIVAGHALFGEALRAALEWEGMDVVALALSAGEALARAPSRGFNLALVDLELPDESGVALGRGLKEISSETRVVVVGPANNAHVASEVVGAGLNGYLTTYTPLAALLLALRAVMAGNIVVPDPPEIALDQSGVYSARRA